MSKTAVFICLLAACMALCCACGEKAVAETSDDNTGLTAATAPPQPVETTAEVTAAEEITPSEPAGKELSISGSVYGRGKSSLSLHIEWKAAQSRDSENCALTVSVFLDCYAISAGEKSGSVNIGGEVYDFKSPVIRNEENISSSYELFTVTADVLSPYSTDVTVNISASYDFYGTYGGVPLGIVTVSDSILLSENGNYINPLTPELPDDAFTPN